MVLGKFCSVRGAYTILSLKSDFRVDSGRQRGSQKKFIFSIFLLVKSFMLSLSCVAPKERSMDVPLCLFGQLNNVFAGLHILMRAIPMAQRTLAAGFTDTGIEKAAAKSASAG